MYNKLCLENIRPLTLHDISPKWADRLYRLPFPLSIQWLRWYFEIKCASKCVVGEAYDFSSSYIYNCKECDRFGWKFMLAFITNSYSKLEENKQLFVKHWDKKHTHK
jgi:hypothetical protein